MHMAVYAGVQMSRTNIDIDDRLIETAMKIHGLKTKREAVDFALRRLVGTPMTREEMLAMQGTGWDGDLDEMRSAPLPWDR
jgi:Arc/MetJ family transcription regulator